MTEGGGGERSTGADETRVDKSYRRVFPGLTVSPCMRVGPLFSSTTILMLF